MIGNIMKNILSVVFIILCFHNYCSAMSGKLVLANGHSVKGDITKTEDGGYWLTTKHGSVKYDNCTLDEGAKAFWAAVERYFPYARS